MPVEGAPTEETSHSDNGTKTDVQEGTLVGEDPLAFPFTLFNHKLKEDNYLWSPSPTVWSVLIFSDAMTDLDIQELANLTAGDADVDNFERLFTKLKEMKGKWWSTNEI